MSRKYKFRDQEKLYFVSFAVVYWIDVFIRNEFTINFEKILAGVGKLRILVAILYLLFSHIIGVSIACLSGKAYLKPSNSITMIE